MQNSKYSLLVITVLLLVTSSAHATGQFLYNEDGSLKLMNQYDAMTACPEGTHLPTIRELAIEGQAHGAKGILEVSQVNPNSIPAGYYEFSAMNSDGQLDSFYFNPEGYIYGAGEGAWYWSSSIPTSHPNVLVGYLHTGIGSNRVIGQGLRNDNNFVAVRCYPGN